jgi:hypothetical protein
MKKLFIYALAAMLAIPAIDLMSKPDTDKDKIAKTTKTTAVPAKTANATATLSAAKLEKRKPKKAKTLKSDKKTLKRKYTYRKGARQI